MTVYTLLNSVAILCVAIAFYFVYRFNKLQIEINKNFNNFINRQNISNQNQDKINEIVYDRLNKIETKKVK